MAQTSLFRKLVQRALTILCLAVPSLPVLQCLLGALPLHWVGYERLPHAGPNTVYVPGAGFSGFYYHLGFLHGLVDRETSTDTTFYCYSSGCLGLVLAPYNIHDIWDAAVTAQQEWFAGKLSRYDVVEHFLHALDLSHTPDNVRILLTDQTHGVRVAQPANGTNLVQLLVQTTAIPWITTPWPSNLESAVLDGGFSRWLHPECTETVLVPTTLATTVHTFNMALDKNTAWSLYDRGLRDAAAAAPTKDGRRTSTRRVAEQRQQQQQQESDGKSNSSSSPTLKPGLSSIQSFTGRDTSRVDHSNWGA